MSVPGDKRIVPTLASDNEQWLEENRELRMDANREMWTPVRRAFHLDRYNFARTFCEGRRVLDGACGTGYGTEILAESAKSVVGIDISNEAIRYAQKFYSADKVRFERSLVEYTMFDTGSFDLVVSFETVEHTLCPNSHLREIARLLQSESGVAIVSVPNAWGYTDHHFFDFNASMIKTLTARYFGVVEFFSQSPGSSSDPTSGKIEPFGEGKSSNAQCIVAVCSKPNRVTDVEDRLEFVMSEIYENVFQRHQEFRTLLYRQNTSILRRVVNRLRTLRL